MQLKGASLVASTRGAAGGYRLARPPQEITLAEVIDVMEGDDRPESNAAKASPLVRALLGFCREVSELERDRLEGRDAGRSGEPSPPNASRCTSSKNC